MLYWNLAAASKKSRRRQRMRTKLLFIAFAMSSLFIFQSQAQTADSGFPKGELSTAKNHTGRIWLSELNVGDSTFDPVLPWQLMMRVQSWIGMLIQAGRFC
jgi:hypothetical protein